jgi:hypothetical protein
MAQPKFLKRVGHNPYLKIAAVVATALTAKLLGAEIPVDAETAGVLPGDLIFQQSTSGQAAAIMEVTHSRYSHCGIVVKRGNDLFVAEAIEPVRVVATPDYALRSLKDWIKAGEDAYAVIKRVHGGLSPERLEQLERSMRRFQGKPYDKLFQWSDDKIYCSEFIYDSFYDPNLPENQRIKIGRVETFGQLDLTGDLAERLIKKRYTDQGIAIKDDEEIITPVSVLKADNLDTVVTFDHGHIQTPTPPPVNQN